MRGSFEGRGSQLQGAQVQLGEASACGIVDNGADITIIGKELFRTVATVRIVTEAV